MIVRGISTNTTEDSLLNYFENTRRSDGGQVEEVKITENTARVKFESSEGIFSFPYVTKQKKKDDVPFKRPSDNEVSQFPVFFPCSSTKQKGSALISLLEEKRIGALVDFKIWQNTGLTQL